MRWAAAWLLFAVGDAISKPMHALDLGFLYPAYNWIMIKSVDTQGEGPGPWKKVEADG